jgi:hypothetical protein
MDGDLVPMLFRAFAIAASHPATFTVDATNMDGMQLLRVVVIDDLLWTSKVAPLLASAGLSVQDAKEGRP